MKTILTSADTNFNKRDVFDLDAAYEEYVDNLPSDDRRGEFHPSGVGSCKRAQVYEYIGAEHDVNAIPSRLRDIFDLGHAIHNIVQSRIESMSDWLFKAKGVRVRLVREIHHDHDTDFLRTHLGVGGTSDALVEIEGPGWTQRGILEIKSIRKEDFESLKEPDEKHVLQAMLYAIRFDCPIIWIWYYCKDNSKRRVFVVKFDHAIAESLISHYAWLLEHVAGGTLPDREESLFSCETCAYANTVCKPAVLKSKYRIWRKQPDKQAGIIPLKRRR